MNEDVYWWKEPDIEWVHGFADRITRLLIQFTGIQEIIDSQLSELNRHINSVLPKISASTAILNTSIQRVVTSELFKELIEFYEGEKGSIYAFNKGGWPIAPSMPRELKNRAVKFYKDGNARYIGQSIIGYYHRENYKNLRLMVHGWENNQFIVPRMRIIRRSLQAHCDRDYLLAIPTIMPQIEGVLNDVVHRKKLTAKLGKIKEVYSEVIGPTDNYDLSRWAIVNTLLHILENNVYSFTPFQNELDKPIKKRETTRHTVLHGADLHYDRPSISLKYFLIIDALSVLEY